MFRRNLLFVAVVILSGCATQTPYQPAEKRGAVGYTETQLTENRYRVTFTGNSLTPSETVKDYALLRAAELTLQHGGDWFEIAGNDIDKKVRSSTYVSGGVDFPATTQVYQRCGLVSCSSTVVSSPGHSFGAGIASTTTDEAYASAIEFVVGKYPMPKNAESYDARQLASTLRRLMSQSGG
jgi:hypothetical protein